MVLKEEEINLVSRNIRFILLTGFSMFLAYLLLAIALNFGDSFSITWSILFFIVGLMMGGIIILMSSKRQRK